MVQAAVWTTIDDTPQSPMHLVMPIRVAVACQRQPELDRIIVAPQHVVPRSSYSVFHLISHQLQEGRPLKVQAVPLQPQMFCCTSGELLSPKYVKAPNETHTPAVPSSSTSGCMQNAAVFQPDSSLGSPSSPVISARSHGRHVSGKEIPLTTSNCASKNGHATVPGPFGLSTLRSDVHRHAVIATSCKLSAAQPQSIQRYSDKRHYTSTSSGVSRKTFGWMERIRTGDSGSKYSSYGPVSVQGPPRCVSNHHTALMPHALSPSPTK